MPTVMASPSSHKETSTVVRIISNYTGPCNMTTNQIATMLEGRQMATVVSERKGILCHRKVVHQHFPGPTTPDKQVTTTAIVHHYLHQIMHTERGL